LGTDLNAAIRGVGSDQVATGGLEAVGGRGAIHRGARVREGVQRLVDLSRILDGGDQAQPPAATRAGQPGGELEYTGDGHEHANTGLDF
jgi:hypothetical protein